MIWYNYQIKVLIVIEKQDSLVLQKLIETVKEYIKNRKLWELTG